MLHYLLAAAAFGRISTETEEGGMKGDMKKFPAFQSWRVRPPVRVSGRRWRRFDPRRAAVNKAYRRGRCSRLFQYRHLWRGGGCCGRGRRLFEQLSNVVAAAVAVAASSPSSAAARSSSTLIRVLPPPLLLLLLLPTTAAMLSLLLPPLISTASSRPKQASPLSLSLPPPTQNALHPVLACFCAHGSTAAAKKGALLYNHATTPAFPEKHIHPSRFVLTIWSSP